MKYDGKWTSKGRGRGGTKRRTVRERDNKTESINDMNDIFTVRRCPEINNNRRVLPKDQSKNEVNEHKNNLCITKGKSFHPSQYIQK